MNDFNKENEKNEEDETYQENKKLQSEQLEAKQLMIAKLLSFMPTLHKLPPKLFRPIFSMMDRILGLKKIKIHQVVDVNIPVSTHNSDTTTIKNSYVLSNKSNRKKHLLKR